MAFFESLLETAYKLFGALSLIAVLAVPYLNMKGTENNLNFWDKILMYSVVFVAGMAMALHDVRRRRLAREKTNPRVAALKLENDKKTD